MLREYRDVEKEEGGIGGNKRWKGAFRSNKKTVIARFRKRDDKGDEEMMRRLTREELREVMKEIKDVKGWREKI